MKSNLRSISSSFLAPLAASALVAACGGDDPPTPRAATASPAPQAAPAPTSNPINSRELDAERVACTDFDEYVNGQWRAATPLTPEGQQIASPMTTAARNSADLQRQIASGGGASAEARLLKAFYDGASNRDAIERAGAAPVLTALARIDAIGDAAALTTHLTTPDTADGSSTILLIAQEGFDETGPVRNMATVVVRNPQGMPEMYADTQAAVASREPYIRANAALLRLAGVADADQVAKTAFETEARIVRRSQPGAGAGAPDGYPPPPYVLVTVEEGNQSVRNIEWGAFFVAQNVARPRRFAISGTDRIGNIDRMIAEVPLTEWKAALKVWALQDAAPHLSTAFQEALYKGSHDHPSDLVLEDENWRRVMSTINTMAPLKQAMSTEYAKRAMTPRTLEVAARMVDDVRAAFRARLDKVEWLSPEARAKAVEKERLMQVVIASSDANMDVSSLVPQMSGYHFANVQAVKRFDLHRMRAAIGTETDLTPPGADNQVANASYWPERNLIVLNAAMLQAPLFDPDSDAPFNYGGLGAVIGHEISHGFDTNGARFAGTGKMGQLWEQEDYGRFYGRADALVKQFNAYEAAPGLFVNGARTVNENIADLGGVHTAYDALQARLASFPAENRLIDGMSPMKRFFVSRAQFDRTRQTPAYLVEIVTEGVHAPARFRINGPLSNMEAFAATFRCEPGQPMARKAEDRVVIW